MNFRIRLFRDAQIKCVDLSIKYPHSLALQSINKQLEYLINIETGTITDRTQLKNIIIGVLAAREVEPLDEDLAEILYKVSGEVSRM